MLDAHFHLPVAQVAEGILCTSTMGEWALAMEAPRNVVPSLGVLPPIGEIDIPNLEQLLSQREDAQIGEIGLDKRFPDKELQIRTLQNIFAVARNLHRMVTLHIVGFDGTILSLLDGTVPALWHGFTSSLESAKGASDKGVVISLGPRCMRSKLWKRIEELKDLPFTVESDATRAEGYQKTLDGWYGTLSARLGWERAKLEQHAKISLQTLLSRTR